MREDFAKLLCERERPRSSNKYHDYRAESKRRWTRDPEAAPTKQSRSDIYGYKHSFNENLSPLRGLIKAWVGRKWDDFYSELNKVCPKNNTINQHVYIHLYGYIDVNVKKHKDGKFYIYDKYSAGTREVGSSHWVHPETNIIHKPDIEQNRQTYAKEAKERSERLKRFRVTISKEIELFNIRGVWYEFIFVPIKVETIRFKRYNHSTKEYIDDVGTVKTPDTCKLSIAISTLLDKGKMRGKPLTEQEVRRMYDLGFQFNDKYKGRDYETIYGLYGKAAVKMKQLSTKEKIRYGVK